MTEPNFIFFIDLDSGKTALQNCIFKITENRRLKSKKKRSGPFVKKIDKRSWHFCPFQLEEGYNFKFEFKEAIRTLI